MRSTYSTVKIPAELASKVDDCVLSNLGYRSWAEVVNDAIRHFERRTLEKVAEAASRDGQKETRNSIALPSDVGIGSQDSF